MTARHRTTWRRRVTDAWLATQLTNYGGKYSIERMLALGEYSGKTSLLHVLLVIVGTPLPVALVVIAQEAVPLQNPADGWSANYGFWIHFGVLAASIAYGTAMHAEGMIDEAKLSSRQIILFSMCVTCCCVLTAMALSAALVFPIPFISITFSTAMVTILVLSFRLVAGGRVFREIAGRRDQLVRFLKFASVQMSMTMIYPAYQVLFQATNNTQWELPVLLLLPAMKLVLKNVFVRTFAAKEDMIPEGVIFTVDFFDALYLATCIQTVRSPATIVVIMAVDLTETAIELHDLHRRTQNILARLHVVAGTKTNLLATVRSLCHHIELSETQMRVDSRVRSCISHEISPEGRQLLLKLDNRSSTGQPERQSSAQRVSSQRSLPVIKMTSTKMWFSSFRGGNVVQPDTAAVVSVNPPRRLSTLRWARKKSLVDNANILDEALEALFTAECLVLTEYLETIIPILYGLFLLVMIHLPSALYHLEMVGLTSANVGGTLQSVFVYGLLEFLSFVVLAVILHRNCGIQALYHLAFVLETQTAPVQSKLILWTIMTLTYRVVHFGTCASAFCVYLS